MTGLTERLNDFVLLDRKQDMLALEYSTSLTVLKNERQNLKQH